MMTEKRLASGVTVAIVLGWMAAAPGSTSAQWAAPDDATKREESTAGDARGASGQGRGWAAPQSGDRGQSTPPPRLDQAPSGDRARARTDERQEDRPAARTRGDRPVVGTAVRRDSRPQPPPRRDRVIVVPGSYNPFGYGGLGFGGYYDPWYGLYPYHYGEQRDDGRLRLKVKPREASVYVDGYYAGLVDDFDGIFQSLPLEPGPYTIEIRANGYAPHRFDVRILPDHKLTYTVELEPIP